MLPDPDRETTNDRAAWVPKGASPADSPHMSDDFARVYDASGTRVTAPIALAALDLVDSLGIIGADTRVLDIAAGTGALSIPAVERGASVLAIDIAPGMVNRLSAKAEDYPGLEVRLMDGQNLELEDASFDATFSIIGVSLFSDWRRGLREQVRVLKPGGRACVATWRTPPGGGPFFVMAQALREVFPERAPPAPPEGFMALADPVRLGKELEEAGLGQTVVQEIEVVWEGPGGEAYLDDLKELHPYMGPYRLLNDEERREVDRVILSIVEKSSINGRVRMPSPVVLAAGTR